MRLFLISNMYPSTQNIRYGIFVKRFEEAIQDDFEVKRIVLTKKEGQFTKLLGYFVLYFKIIKLYFFSRKEDMVYVHFPLYFSWLLIPLLWKKVSLVLNFHGSDAVFNTMLKRILLLGLKPVVRKCRKVVVPSEHYKNRISEIFGVNSSKTFVYPSGGVDSRVFHPIEKEDDGFFIIGFISNFIENKGWLVFLDALTRLKLSGRALNSRAIMVGDGPDKEKIRNYIHTNGLNVLLIDSVEQSELANIYSGFDIFVFPTHRESLGLVGLEALMCGIPVVASRVQGPMGYIKDGSNGFLFENKNSEDLANKIIQFRQLSQEEIVAMKKECLATAQAYESQKVKIELLKFLKEMGND